MTLSDQDAEKVEAAFKAAQAKTRAPIECVLVEASGAYEAPALVAALLLALIAPWPLILFTSLSPERIFVVQLVVALTLALLLSLRGVRALLTPSALKRANAHRAALAQFLARGLDRGPERNGVLVFVSLEERYARIVADEGCASAIAETAWQGVVEALVVDFRAGRLPDALVSAADRCASLLAAPFPPALDAPARPHRHFHFA